MIEIYVASYKGVSPPVELKGVFGPAGGTIGRANDNNLVLPDPARHVSRLQAQVSFDGERYFVVNVANANPLFINDDEVASGTELPIGPGDELRIGLYVLGVREAVMLSPSEEVPVTANHSTPPSRAAVKAHERPVAPGGPLDPLAGLGSPASSLNPFADLLGPGVAMPPIPDAPAPSLPAGRRPDPLAGNFLESPPSRPAPLAADRVNTPQAPLPIDPFADLLQPNTPAMPAHRVPPGGSGRGAAQKSASTSEIPTNFDPFAMPSGAPRNTNDPLRDLAAASIDLGSVDANAQRSDLLEFELARKPDARDPLGSGTPSLVDSLDAVDPMRLFGGDEKALLNLGVDPLAGGMPMPDQVPEVNAHFKPPRALPERSNLQPGAGRPAWSGAPSGQAPIRPATPTSPASLGTTPIPVRPAGMPRPAAPAQPPQEARPRVSPPAAPAAATPGAPQADLSALLAAFLKGARVSGTPVRSGLTPALMEAIGTLVYQATAGAMELIAARQITKREIRAEVTIIVPQGNNPLKFLPTPEAAIMQMLGPGMPGFISTAKAMQEVFGDLRAHEVGVIAGMRAALAEVLLRFDPATLERRLGKGGLLETLIPTSRQAKLWSLYKAQFQEIYREAQDDYQALFGEAFIKAYEEQVQKDEKDQGRG